ncbi:hypothetical protein MMC07_002557 [Pseudocyphellaria aurata]|nr:hypothetical protein [Pseudocyphellaria aurata]
MSQEEPRDLPFPSPTSDIPSASFGIPSNDVVAKSTSLNGENTQQKTRQEAVETFKKKIEDLDKEMTIMRKEIEELYAWLAAEAKGRFRPLLENFLILFIETLCGRRGIPIPDTACNELKCQKAKYVALASTIESRNWEADYGISIMYHEVVLAFPNYMLAKTSNFQRTEAEFAKDLVSYHKGSPKYSYWGALFPFCLGETVEKVASRFDDTPGREEILAFEMEDIVG